MLGEYTYKTNQNEDLSVLVETTDEVREYAKQNGIQFRSLYAAIMAVPTERMARFEEGTEFAVYSDYFDGLVLARITFSGNKSKKILKTATVVGLIPKKHVFHFKKRRMLFEVKDTSRD